MLTPSLLDLESSDPELHCFSTLWANAKSAFNARDFEAATADLDAAVNEVEQNVLAVTLLKRAVTHSCQGNLQAALRDAYRVMELAPCLGEGYLCAGSLLQSTERYGEAINIYSKGILATTTEEPSGSGGTYGANAKIHQRLVHAKHAIEESINQINSQTLKKLPLELAHSIFADLLSFEDRLQCMYTCRWWRAFLVEELPRVSSRLILGNMPKEAMAQLVASCGSDHDNELGFKDGHTVSILPQTSAVSFQNALTLLNGCSVQMKCFDVLTELDGSKIIKELLGRLLQQNGPTLEKLTLCTVKDVPTTMDALYRCPNLSHLIISADHRLLAEQAAEEGHSMPGITYTGRDIHIHGRRPRPVVVYPRDVFMEDVRQSGVAIRGYHEDPIRHAESMVRKLHWQNSLQTKIDMSHLELTRLDLIDMEISHFLDPVFWGQLPYLEYLAIKNAVGFGDDFNSIAKCISRSCPNLKTLRYGTGWDDDTTTYDATKDDIHSKEREDKHGEEEYRTEYEYRIDYEGGGGFREIIVRSPWKNTIAGGYETVIIPTLIGPSSYRTLQVLHLQLEVLTQTGLDELVQLPLPRLCELQLYLRPGVFWEIQPHHIASLVENCPSLARVVLNRVRLGANALFEFTNASRQQLRSLYIVQGVGATPVFMSTPMPVSNDRIPDAVVGRPHRAILAPDPQVSLLLRAAQHQSTQQRAAQLQAAHNQIHQQLLRQQTRFRQQQQIATGIPHGANPHSARREEVSAAAAAADSSIFGPFAAKYTHLTEICIGNTTALTDSDLLALTTNNRALTTLKLIACSLLTAHGLEAAFTSSCCITPATSSRMLSVSYPQPALRHVTLVHLRVVEDFVITSLVKRPSLEELVLIECPSLKYSTVFESVEQVHQQRRRTFASSYLNGSSASNSSTSSEEEEASLSLKQQHVLRTYYIYSLSRNYAIPTINDTATMDPAGEPQTTRLIECIPRRQSLVTRTLADISIAKPIVDYI